MSLQLIHEYFDERLKEADDNKKYDVEKARGLSVAYTLQYANDGYRTIAVEQSFELDIMEETFDSEGNPVGSRATGRKHCGLIDWLFKDGEKHYFGDHKVVSKVDDNYWQELRTNAQLSQYWLAALQMGIELDGFLWDVIVKPGIKPKKLDKKAIAELEDGSYCGLPFMDYNGENFETPKMYGIRVQSECIQNPDKYFFRRMQYRDPDSLLEYAGELVVESAEIAEARSRTTPEKRRQVACKDFNRICDYHLICSGLDPDLVNYQPRKSDQDRKQFSSESVSVSQIQCWQRCPRAWQYRYRDKIEPIRAEYSEPLAIGSMVHKALELWLPTKG